MQRNEIFNTVSHLIGAVMALAGAAILIVFASLEGNPWKIVSFSVYGFTLIVLYIFSTLYHGLSGKAKKVFSILDHQAIYLLIAGTYTPFTLITLKGAWGWSIFGSIWGLAALGIVLDSLPIIRRHKRIIPVIIYILMGWMVVIALNPLLQILPEIGFNWLLAGGLLYTFGIIFYALSDRYTYAHGIWHIFVLAGSISHYIAILYYV